MVGQRVAVPAVCQEVDRGQSDRTSGHYLPITDDHRAVVEDDLSHPLSGIADQGAVAVAGDLPGRSGRIVGEREP